MSNMLLNCHNSSKQFYNDQILIKRFIRIQEKSDGEKVIDKIEMTVKSINGVASSGYLATNGREYSPKSSCVDNSFRMVCFVQGKVKKCFIALPSPLIMKKIYPIEYIIILNQTFAEEENYVGIYVAVVRE